MLSRTLPPVGTLVTFDAVVRRGGMKAAALELGVSTPAVSQAIRQLEANLDTRLFDRRFKPARLTREGREFHRCVANGLGEVADAAARLRERTAAYANTVTVACNLGFATYWLMPRLSTFHDRHPGLFVNVMTTYQGAPEMAPGIDIVVAFASGDAGELLFREVIQPLCAPAYLERRGPVADLDTLATLDLLHVDADERRWFDWAQYFEARGRPRVGVVRGLHYSNYVQVTQAALAGAGVLLGWIATAGDLVRGGQLVPVLAGGALEMPDGYLMTVREGKAAVETVRAWLVETARER